MLGFLTYESHHPSSAEITRMAVQQDVRRMGIGRRMMAQLVEVAIGDGLQMLFVVALGPSALEPDVTDGYGGTRMFYEATGFVPLKELDSWDPDSPGLVLARAL